MKLINEFLDSLQWDDKAQAPFPNISKILCDQTFQAYSFQHRQFFKSNSFRDLVALCRTDTMNLLIATTTKSHLELDLQFGRHFFSVCHQLSLYCYCSLEADRQYAQGSGLRSNNCGNTRGKWTGLSLSIYCYIPLPSTLTYTNQPRGLALSTDTTDIRVATMVRLENVEKYTGGGSDGVKERRGVGRSMGLRDHSISDESQQSS